MLRENEPWSNIYLTFDDVTTLENWFLFVSHCSSSMIG